MCTPEGLDVNNCAEAETWKMMLNAAWIFAPIRLRHMTLVGYACYWGCPELHSQWHRHCRTSALC